MGWRAALGRWYDMRSRLTGRQEVDEQVRRTLVRSLYSQPYSLAVGSLAGILSAIVAASVTGEPTIQVFAFALVLVGAIRLVLVVHLSGQLEYSTRTLERTYAVGAFAQSIILGIVAALTLSFDSPSEVQAFALISAVGYGCGVCARNAGRPFIALGQLALTALPIAIAALAQGTAVSITMSVCVVLLVAGMASIVNNLFVTLRDAIAAAETSAVLADKMQHLARTDVLTGLANRAGLNHAVIERVMSLGEDRRLALFWLDLDRFKEVNDLLGHPVGDRVLTEVAKRLNDSVPAGATIARFGGDEFIVIVDVASRTECERLAARVLEHATRPLRIDGHRLEVPASMGIALFPEDASDADALMQGADLALYQAKIGGKNHSRFYDQSMSRDLLRRREIEAELRSAIQRDELSIFFQPIVDLDSGRIRSFEALVRWFHPIKGELKPGEFIPLAEETGVIVTLGNWITAQAARTAVHWPADVSISVNLSPLQIKAPGAALGILSALREAGLDPARLELEVTESLFLEDDHTSAHFIHELSEAGVRFALDDFGTGYSSLGYIDRFPFSKVKVDRSFVSGPNVGRKSEAIIRAVAEMGAQLGMEIVAEGIETLDQLHTVRAAGCSLGQGYYFSRAVPDYLAAMLLAQEREPIRGRQVA